MIEPAEVRRIAQQRSASAPMQVSTSRRPGQTLAGWPRFALGTAASPADGRHCHQVQRLPLGEDHAQREGVVDIGADVGIEQDRSRCELRLPASAERLDAKEWRSGIDSVAFGRPRSRSRRRRWVTRSRFPSSWLRSRGCPRPSRPLAPARRSSTSRPCPASRRATVWGRWRRWPPTRRAACVRSSSTSRWKRRPATVTSKPCAPFGLVDHGLELLAVFDDRVDRGRCARRRRASVSPSMVTS